MTRRSTQLVATVLLALLGLEAQGAERVIHYHNDALCSRIAATDEHGNRLWCESYAPYGQCLLKQTGGATSIPALVS